MPEGRKKVLIIEDDDHISKVYEIKLGKENIDIVIARDGEEGINMVASEKPDIVLLDLMIPIKDGFIVLEEVKKTPFGKNVPIVVISNLGQQGDIEKAMKLGAADYLIKVNLSIQEVIDKVKKHLGK